MPGWKSANTVSRRVTPPRIWEYKVIWKRKQNNYISIKERDKWRNGILKVNQDIKAREQADLRKNKMKCLEMKHTATDLVRAAQRMTRANWESVALRREARPGGFAPDPSPRPCWGHASHGRSPPLAERSHPASLRTALRSDFTAPPPAWLELS